MTVVNEGPMEKTDLHKSGLKFEYFDNIHEKHIVCKNKNKMSTFINLA